MQFGILQMRIQSHHPLWGFPILQWVEDFIAVAFCKLGVSIVLEELSTTKDKLLISSDCHTPLA
jgi:hypothetical protein